jgi:4-hydroxythreonine-4-phosphate dehydrogenase
VTAPVSKAAITATGVDFPGHTEFLARTAGTGKFVMMFVAGERRVALVTTHLSLVDVPRAITRERVLEKLVILNAGLELWFGVKHPRIAVTGLNPHAGESGIFGSEETEQIAPAIRTARERGILAEGPFAADTIFTGLGGAEGPGSGFDAVLAMYHDQGTIPIKILGFSDGVNVTLGLPIVRTSVDHGTAFDLAGKGQADPGSMISAVSLARDIAYRLRRLESAEREFEAQ